MTISVLISVYQSEKADYLNRALESVWDDQTLKPDQIVLVEDGALGEALRDVVDCWKEKLGDVLTIVKNETNLGLTKSLNRGLQMVTSDLVARMDSDDISTPQRFELQMKYMEQHPDIDVLGGSLQEFDDEKSCLNVRHYPLTHEDVLKTMYKVCPVAHPTVMMRKRMFDSGLKYNEKYRMSQDIALWYDAVIAGFHIANIEEITILFRRANDVYKRRSRVKAWNEFCIYMNGIKRLYGIFTLKYIYPIARLIFRLMPVWIVKWGYQSKLRRVVSEGRKAR